MKNATFGIRVHSGWAVIVCMSGDPAAPSVVDRRRIVIIEQAMEGAKQPYHFVESLVISQAERHLERCAAVAQRLGLQAIHAMLDAVSAAKHRVVGCGMLLASGRPLPALPNILASHALVHAAEGEFFRKVVREACESCHIPVIGIRERELDKQADRDIWKGCAFRPATHLKPWEDCRFAVDAGREDRSARGIDRLPGTCQIVSSFASLKNPHVMHIIQVALRKSHEPTSDSSLASSRERRCSRCDFPYRPNLQWVARQARFRTRPFLRFTI